MITENLIIIVEYLSFYKIQDRKLLNMLSTNHNAIIQTKSLKYYINITNLQNKQQITSIKQMLIMDMREDTKNDEKMF